MEKVRVMVVEDDEAAGLLIRIQLEKIGYEVVAMAQSPEAAIEAFQKTQPDIVLLDIHLTGKMDGVAVAETISLGRSGVPIIYVTADAHPQTLERAQLSVPSAYLVKPIDTHQLRSAIELALYKHRVGRALELREVLLATVLDTMRQGLIVTDSAGQIQYINRVAEEMLGHAAGSAKGLFVGQVLPSTEAGATRDHPVSTLLKGGETSFSEERLLTVAPNRVVPVEVDYSLMKDLSGSACGVVVLVRDVTERKHIEETMRRVSKLQAVETLAGGVSHNFNNALHVILGHAELALNLLPAEHAARRSLQTILNRGRRSTEIVRQLMAFAQHHHPQICSLDIVSHIENSVLPMLHVLLGENTQVRWVKNADFAYILADAASLDESLFNLVSNARDAMPEGGTVTISVSTRELARRPDGQAGGPNRTYVIISVEDTGTGMTSEELSHLFEPFFTTKGPDRGVGLGLPTVFATVRQHGGFLDVSSTAGKGTVVHLHFPTAADASLSPVSAPAPAPEAAPPPAAPIGRTILVVDDEAEVLELVGRSLRGLGYTVLEAASGPKAMTAAAQHVGTIDLMICDVMMPGFSGPDLAVKLQTIRPEMKVLLMTGYAPQQLQHMLHQLHRLPRIQKPFDMRSLNKMVLELMD